MLLLHLVGLSILFTYIAGLPVAMTEHYASRRWAPKMQVFTFPTPIDLYIAVLRHRDNFAFGISILPST